jgi:curved DNA-binding protein CbpA
MKDYYAILGIARSASDRTIKETYRRLAKKYHPDVNASPDAEYIFKEINEAYEVLSDPERRAQYDLPLHYEFTSNATPEVVHADPAYHRKGPRPVYETNTQRIQRLKEEYKHIFIWACKIGIAFAILIVLDVVIPSTVSNEEIVDIQYKRARRGGSWNVIYTSEGRKFNYYPGTDTKKISLKLNSVYSLEISPIFSNVLSIHPENSLEYVWIERIYTNFSFFPIIMLVAASIGLFFKKNTDVALNCGTVAFVLGLISLFLVL